MPNSNTSLSFLCGVYKTQCKALTCQSPEHHSPLARRVSNDPDTACSPASQHQCGWLPTTYSKAGWGVLCGRLWHPAHSGPTCGPGDKGDLLGPTAHPLEESTWMGMQKLAWVMSVQGRMCAPALKELSEAPLCPRASPSSHLRLRDPPFSGACCGSSSFASTCSSGVPVTRCQGHTVCSSPGQQDAVPALPERREPFHGPYPEKQNHKHALSTGSEGLPTLSSGPWLTDSRCRAKRNDASR